MFSIFQCCQCRRSFNKVCSCFKKTVKRASLEPHYCNIVDVQVLRSQSGFALKKGCILSLWQSHRVEGRNASKLQDLRTPSSSTTTCRSWTSPVRLTECTGGTHTSRSVERPSQKYHGIIFLGGQFLNTRLRSALSRPTAPAKATASPCNWCEFNLKKKHHRTFSI